MREHTVLGQVALGYSPLVDRRREVLAARLTVFPQRPEATWSPADAAALLAALEAVWPRPAATASGAPARPLDPVAAGARTPGAERPVLLNIAGEGLLQAVLAAQPPGQFLIEVPAFMAADPAQAAALKALHAAGSVLLIKGRPTRPLAPEVLACFSHSLVDAGDDRRGDGAAPAGVRRVTTVQTGVRSAADVAQAFDRGAVAVLGWTHEEPVTQGDAKRAVPADVSVVMDLIRGVDREEPAPKLEAMLKREPTIAFRLLRYLNSPAFGLSVEVNSFGHAVMLLGHQRLKRWLALLLASSSNDPGARATMHAAVRRGLFMEELARPHGDSEMSGEMFICGVFSLLDRLLGQPVALLLEGVPVPERVRLALLGEGGPYQPYLQLVQAVEQEAVFDIREAAERLMLQPLEVNAALLTALKNARQVD
ncbi:MAG: HDOD domain-containing protein [Rubrivivax sp.]|nr:HDOD domain-containing protein [Rubrivivax sp.]